MPEPVRRSPRFLSPPPSPPPLDVQQISSHLLGSLVSKIDKKREVFLVLAALRATCKTFQIAIDLNVNFGKSFFSSWKFKPKNQIWKANLVNLNIFQLFRKYYFEPRTIVAFDYSLSMDLAVNPNGENHIDVALPILKKIFDSQTQKLRSKITLLLFGSEMLEVVIKTESILELTMGNIANRDFQIDRGDTNLELVFDYLVGSKTAPLVSKRTGRSAAIHIISDNTFALASLEFSMKLLKTHALKHENKSNTYSVRFITTGENEMNEIIFDYANTQAEIKSKRKIFLILDTAHEAKRLRPAYSEDEMEDVSFDNPYFDAEDDISYEESMDSLATPPPPEEVEGDQDLFADESLFLD